jgi:hypothetical protein
MKALLSSFLLVTGIAAEANAVTLTATSLTANVPSFVLTYDDLNNDSLLQFGEVTSFSGIYVSDPWWGSFDYRYLTSVPDIPGIADHAGGSSGQSCQPIDCWSAWSVSIMDDGTVDASFPQNWFSYVVSTPGVVPLPAGLPLMLSAMAGLEILRRRRRTTMA